MGLEKTYQSKETKVNLPNAYFKISDINLKIDQILMLTIHIDVYRDYQTYSDTTSKTKPVEKLIYKIDDKKLKTFSKDGFLVCNKDQTKSNIYTLLKDWDVLDNAKDKNP